jgi:hypothetical protein
MARLWYHDTRVVTCFVTFQSPEVWQQAQALRGRRDSRRSGQRGRASQVHVIRAGLSRLAQPARRMDFPHFAAFQSPIVLPSGSANQAKVPLGIVTGGTTVLPPSDSAFASAAGTSSTST